MFDRVNGDSFKQRSYCYRTKWTRKNCRNNAVDVEGAVVKPGVYSINLDARVKDTLIAASGLGNDADRDWVTKNLDIVAKVSDDSKIYIPRFGESVQATVLNSGIVRSAGAITVNSAGAQELDNLPGNRTCYS